MSDAFNYRVRLSSRLAHSTTVIAWLWPCFLLLVDCRMSAVGCRYSKIVQSEKKSGNVAELVKSGQKEIRPDTRLSKPRAGGQGQWLKANQAFWHKRNRRTDATGEAGCRVAQHTTKNGLMLTIYWTPSGHVGRHPIDGPVIWVTLLLTLYSILLLTSQFHDAFLISVGEQKIMSFISKSWQK